MTFTTTRFGGKDTARNETLFTTGNGNLGFRGDTEEAAATVHKGTYINGFYDSEPIQYGETAYGYAKNHETILNLPDPKRIELGVDGKRFGLTGEDGGAVAAFRLELDEEAGLLRRLTDWRAGKNAVRVESCRLVSFCRPDCALIRYSVTNTSASPERIELVSAVDVTAQNILAEEDPRIGAKFRHKSLVIDAVSAAAAGAANAAGAEGAGVLLSFDAHTAQSGLLLSGAVLNLLSAPGAACALQPDSVAAIPSCRAELQLAPGASVTLTKYIAYCHAPAGETTGQALRQKAREACGAFARAGFETACREQKAFLADFWRVADIRIEEETAPGPASAGEGERSSVEEALRFNLFHLLQSAGRSGRASIAAKGLTSEGYEGHYFWDTESYVCPVFTYTAPAVAKQLLAYRSSILDKARKRAQVMSLQGALYPWRTISGEETSAYFPAGTAQYHINADIIFAMNRFAAAHGLDGAAMAVMLAESARMYYSLGHFAPHKGGAFCIDCVTGPDEYTAVVNNNAFTNLMVRETFELAVRLSGTAASEEEKADWKQAAEKMYIPFDKGEGVYPQDDSFMDKPDWDFAATPKSCYPLLLHYHPLVIYRHRVLKQPDLVLALFLLSGRFSLAEKIRNFRFYEPYTTGDSSLSHCIMSIMAAETGDSDKALDYFNKTVRMDIDDVNGNSRDGIHTACMAGSWMGVVYGFAGFRDYGGDWRFNPRLPKSWKRLSFTLAIQGALLDVCITRDEAVYSLRPGDGSQAQAPGGRTLRLTHRKETFTLKAGESRAFSLKPKLGAVLFDLDGVITDTAPLHYKAWKEMADKEGLRFDREMNKQLLGISREASLEVILRENGADWTAEKKADVCYRKNERYKELLSTLTSSDILPGILSLLESLKEQGVPCALASSSRNAPAILKALGLAPYFSALADAASVQKAKPEPDLFLDAAERCGAWYTDCIGIEDAYAGVAAIKAAGMKAVGITTSMPLAQADLQLASTAELSYDKLLAVMEET